MVSVYQLAFGNKGIRWLIVFYADQKYDKEGNVLKITFTDGRGHQCTKQPIKMLQCCKLINEGNFRRTRTCPQVWNILFVLPIWVVSISVGFD